MNLKPIQPSECPEHDDWPNFETMTDQEIEQYIEIARFLKSISPEQFEMIKAMTLDAERMLAEGYSDAEIAQHLDHYYGAV